MKFSKFIFIGLVLTLVLSSCTKSNVYTFDTLLDPDGKYSFTYDDALWQRDEDNPGQLVLKNDPSCAVVPGAGGKGFEGPEWEMVRRGNVNLLYERSNLALINVNVDENGELLFDSWVSSAEDPEACMSAFVAFMEMAYPSVVMPEEIEMTYSSMSKYENPNLGLSFEYPSAWSLEEEDKDDGTTEIRLVSGQIPDGYTCEEDLGFMSFVFNKTKKADQSFADFVKSSEIYTPDPQFGRLSGDIKEVKVAERDAYYFEGAGWETYCPSHEYLVETSSTSYMEIVVMYKPFNKGLTDNVAQQQIAKILETVTF